MGIADRRPRIPLRAGFEPVRRAVVVGAGTMGAGIAAHLANCGIEVTLLDRAGEGGDRSALARAGIERQLAMGAFMAEDFAARVTPGNTADDLAACSAADWVVEAVFEDLDIKRDLYRRLEEVLRPGTLVSSNTSTIPLHDLVAGRSTAFRRHFTNTHFFNPPRTMELLEVVAGADTSPEVLARVTAVGDRQLGKVVVQARDTPGFIANRLGSQWMAVGAVEAFRAGLDVETADAIMSRPFGIPHTGVFGLFDLVGINLVPGIWGVFTRELPASDACHRYDITGDPIFTHLLRRGLIGRRGPGGFHRRRNAAGDRVDEVLDLTTLEYRPRRTPEDPAASASDLAGALAADSPGGRYAWTVLAEVLEYTCVTAPEIADDVHAIDESIRWGYGWARGPFEMADALGVTWLAERFAAEGREVPPLLARAVVTGGFHPDADTVLATDGRVVPRPRTEGVLTVAEAERAHGVLAQNASAAVVDLGDGVACLSLRTKMNTCDAGVLEMVERATRMGGEGAFRALVIGSDHPRAFSAGANLAAFVHFIDTEDAAGLRALVERGQRAFAGLRAAPFPVVAAVRGFALGGGCELMLGAHRVVAHAEARIGFPERTVGLVPAWGGVTQSLARAAEAGEADPAASAFAVTAGAGTSGSAWEAAAWHLLRGSDEVVPGTRRVLAEAKAVALDLASAGHRDDEVTWPLPLHDPGAGALDAGWAGASETDRAIVGRLAAMLTGSSPDARVDEESMLTAEADAAVDLLARPANRDRVRHLFETNRPLAN